MFRKVACIFSGAMFIRIRQLNGAVMHEQEPSEKMELHFEGDRELLEYDPSSKDEG